MAKTADVNFDTTTHGGAEVFFRLKTLLKAAGWTVPSSGDATSYSSSSDIITTAAILNVTRAWFILRDPGGRREWCVQRGTTALIWRIKYSALDRFTGGSPDPDQVPSATDESVLIGTGTDAAPVGGSLFAASGTYRGHCVVQSTPTGNVYPFYAFGGAAGALSGFIYQEPLQPGTFPAADADPTVLDAIGGATGGTVGTSTASPKFWYRMNLGGEAFVSGYGLRMTRGDGQACIPSTSVNNPIDADDNGVPIPIARRAAETQPGWKGFTQYMKYPVQSRSGFDTCNLTTDAYIYLGDVLVPWPDNVVPVL